MFSINNNKGNLEKYKEKEFHSSKIFIEFSSLLLISFFSLGKQGIRWEKRRESIMKKASHIQSEMSREKQDFPFLFLHMKRDFNSPFHDVRIS